MRIYLFSLFFLLSSVSAQALNSRLGIAVEMDDLSTVRKAIENGEATVDERVIADPYASPDMPIILIAARAGSEKVAKYLIENGVNVNAKNPKGETALMMAVYFDDALYGGIGDFSKQDRVAKMLVAAGADLENGNWWAPLSYAAYRDRIGIGTHLIQKGAKVDGPLENDIAPVNTPLMMAVLPGHKAFSLLVLRNGANAKIKNKKGLTALELARLANQTHLYPYLECAEKLRPGQHFQEICE